MSESNRNDIILAAINAVGKPDEGKDWEAEVTMKAIEIAVLTGENSNVAKAVDVIATCKVFKGTVVEVEKEQSSTRGIITLDTGTEREQKHSITKTVLPAGQEQIRTDRTDGALGKALAIKARGLKFHSVLVWVEVETVPGKDFKVRVLRHIQDLGIDPAYAAQAQAAATAAAAPAPAAAPAA